MADAEFDDFGGYSGYRDDGRAPVRGADRARSWVNGAGAVTSVALIVGLGVWGYDLAVRDVRGIPVIRALEGPARTAPENPGGELASYQGMAVNEIAADGTAGDPADRLTLAPKVEGLAEEDRPMGVLAAASEATEPAPDAPSEAPSEALSTGAPATPDPAPLSVPSDAAAPVLASLRPNEPLPDGPADALAEGTDPLFAEEPAIEVPEGSADAISAEIPGVSRSLRPAARPGGVSAGADAPYDAIAEAAAAAVAEALGGSAPAALDVAPGTLAEGTRLVQIGAYPDEARARLEWDKTASRFGALMDGKRRVIESAVSAGETFYRLRVEGFTDIEDARRFCEVLKAEGADCVPTTVR